jgi:hypothetical protein
MDFREIYCEGFNRTDADQALVQRLTFVLPASKICVVLSESWLVSGLTSAGRPHYFITVSCNDN